MMSIKLNVAKALMTSGLSNLNGEHKSVLPWDYEATNKNYTNWMTVSLKV